MVQHVMISWMVWLIALTVLVYLDMREPIVNRTSMNVSLIHAKMEDFVQMRSINTHVCAHQTLKE